MKKNTKILLVCLLVALVLAAAAIGLANRPQAVEGAKAVTVEVIHGDGSQKVFELHTDAETLRQACEEKNLIAGQESQYGLFIQSVDGETADDSLQQWWCITKGGEVHNYGADETMIADGDRYEFTLTTGW